MISDVQQVDETVRDFGPCTNAHKMGASLRAAYSEKKNKVPACSGSPAPTLFEDEVKDCESRINAGRQKKNTRRELQPGKGKPGKGKPPKGSRPSGDAGSGKTDKSSKGNGMIGGIASGKTDKSSKGNGMIGGVASGNEPLVTLALPVPLNGCTFSGHTNCATRLQVSM